MPPRRVCTPAGQANRFFMMDTREIKPDPCDNQIIRCHNCLQCLACIFELAACVTGAPRLARSLARAHGGIAAALVQHIDSICAGTRRAPAMR